MGKDMRNNSTTRRKNTRKVYIQNPLPIFKRILMDRDPIAPCVNPGIVHQNLNLTKMCRNLIGSGHHL